MRKAVRGTRVGGLRVAAAAVAALLVLGSLPAHAVVVAKQEASCASKLGKGAAKLAKTVAKEVAKCRANDISGKAIGACPSAGNQAKIDSVAGKLSATAEKSCKSVCSLSSHIDCISSALCPPLATSRESCSAGAKSITFEMKNIGFPGPFCEAAIGQELLVPEDIGECVAEVSEDASLQLIDVVYGSITNASGLDATAQGCLGAISKGVQKLSSTVVKGVAKCTDGILKGAPGDPANCQTSDAKLAAKIAKIEAKLDAGIDDKCDLSSILLLDVCGNGVGQTLTIADAKSCLKAAAREISDSSVTPVLRTYSSVSVINAAYPPAPRCGDNTVNQLPNLVALLGEECDGTDDSACPGDCLPPGDLFECTCGDKPRMRLFANHLLTDADAGWTGKSHQQGVADLSGYITEMSNCDCDGFSGPTCTGNTSDTVCDVSGFQLPTCSWEPFGGTRCDVRGNANGSDQDLDCAICDQYSANPGTFCLNESACNAQCYDGGGLVTGPCTTQADCAAGEICRGQCDKSQTCLIVPNGAPLPVVAASTGVCSVQTFRDDVVGTRNLVTGEHVFNYRVFAQVYLGEQGTRPCPVCGGFCIDGAKNLEICHGRCSVTSTTECRFDVDCPSGETCSSATPDCPGGSCQLELVCGSVSDTVTNKPCIPEYEHPFFGSMSNDCLPASQPINGQGFSVEYLPATTGVRSLASLVPCTFPGFQLLECPCQDGGGAPTKPNSCNPACDAPGPNFGVGCKTGNTSGDATKCAGGVNGGKICDEDSDCPLSSCSLNPNHCSGDPAFAQFECTTNADCGAGICGDACPGGRCTLLCVPDPGDPLDGLCAGGPDRAHCAGADFTFIECLVSAANSGSCAATCSVAATPCNSLDDCPSGETCVGPCQSHSNCEAGMDGIMGSLDDRLGAGACILDDTSCYLEPLTAEGGSTVNGQGDPENDNTVGVFCYSATNHTGTNSTAGFGGPGRVRQKGLNVTNGFTAIP